MLHAMALHDPRWTGYNLAPVTCQSEEIIIETLKLALIKSCDCPAEQLENIKTVYLCIVMLVAMVI